MTDLASVWANPKVVYAIGASAIFFLVVTIWLFRRQERSGRQAAVICLLLSVLLHAALFYLVPLIPNLGGSARVDAESAEDSGVTDIAVAVFDEAMMVADESMADEDATIMPLPVGDISELLEQVAENIPEPDLDASPDEVSDDGPSDVDPSDEAPPQVPVVPESLTRLASEIQTADDADEDLDDWLDDSGEEPAAAPEARAQSTAPPPVASTSPAPTSVTTSNLKAASAPVAKSATAGDVPGDFANRVGAAKQSALYRTGGDTNTEAAVAEALRFLASRQRSDGSFDARAAGAGLERRPLGESRADQTGRVAGSNSDTASTGLAILAMLGAGNTHRSGDYSDNVYRGLVYLMTTQKPSGSLAGDATLYASNYCHGMAALAMAEAAVMTGDPSAVEGTRRALRFTQSMQHPVTGGFRYTPGDPGDLSQLGWQAMVIDGGQRVGLPQTATMVTRSKSFLRSVRAGRSGGLASYRPREEPTRTMTAEALATRLLLGETVPKAEVFEAEQSLLQQPPGVGQDNYYYWYYATLGLHQLQDAAWQRWNKALKARLLATQRPDGSWPTDSVWGGYGGSIYTTSMATLCLETYYRHDLRSAKQVASTARRQPAGTR